MNSNDCPLFFATYGTWGEGLCSSLRILCGKKLQVYSIDTSKNNFTEIFEILLKKLSDNEPAAVFSDGLNPEADAFWEKQLYASKIVLARNVSLPMALRFISLINEHDPVARLEQACFEAREQCLYVNPLIEKIKSSIVNK